MTREFLQDGFDEVLGLGAGDEDGGSDVERETVKLLFAGDVLDRLVSEATRDGGLVCGGLLACEQTIRIRIEGGAGEIRGVQEEDERVLGGGEAQLW